MLGDDQKIGCSSQEQPLCSGNLMMFMKNQDPSCRDYSEVFSGVSSNYIESVGDRSNGEIIFIPPVVGILDDPNFQCQGVSLSLSTHSPSVVSMSSFPHQYQTPAMASSFINASSSIFEKRLNPKPYNGMHIAAGSGNSTLNLVYVEAAQQVLDEMVSIREALKELKSRKLKGSSGLGVDFCRENDGGCNDMNGEICSGSRESSIANSLRDLSPTERQNLKSKNSKLLSLLGEVDRRYKQYYEHLQLLSSSFDTVAGRGAAEFYTALAHQTISCHFRRLQDAINAQIEVTRRTLGEQDTSHFVQEGIPRLRFVDQHLRQQRALQQLGVTPHSWRPQRGLPESSVSILRAWLFEHFLHPYPKDSEKLKLSRQTGLTRNQVANWFINARVRLWKPMVEEMYKEEFGDSNMDDIKSSPENASKASWNNSLFSEDRGGDELHELHEQVLYPSCSTNDMIKSTNFSVGGDVSLALELKHCEGDEFGMFGSSTNRMVGSVELEAQDLPCLEPERHHQCRLTSSNMLHDFVV
ncbi:BEL1-like homeodomain protein 7 [Cucurbita moschata]|uniref:BEL1-like homeodomain protein 7 n=1 Tax=Cucurbita moschata TaxID=3662 RepID=A0A6J1GMJ8_CUCMO|nr:BEL1-like homeodomain protein 7 [Cucurbita moschata]